MTYRRRRKLKLTTFGKLFIFSVVSIFIILCLLLAKCAGGKTTISSADTESTGSVISEKQETVEKDKTTAAKKVKYFERKNKTKTLEMDSKYGILADLEANSIIAEKRADKIIYPASLTKVMTLIVAVENIEDLEETFTFNLEILDPLYIEEASVAGFLDQETVPIKDLLYGAILPSGADATTALALHIAGSEEKFVELMNNKVKEMGLQDTHFTNCSGLHDKNHYSTVHEIALIMKYAMENETCREILSTLEYTTTKTPQNPEGIHLYSNTFERMYGTEAVGVTILAGKTGYTNESGNCLVSYAEDEDGKGYILVTTGASGSYKPIFDAIEIYAKHVGTGETDIRPDIPTDSTVIY